jgi:DNA-binding MarR family transcriptional regulator
MSAPGPGASLFAFVRHWSRRASPETAEQGRLVLVTEAVHALAERGVPATVNAVAREVGIDQSGASRLVKAAVEAGHLELRAPEEDGRRREAAVTASGRALIGQARAWQERVFARLTEGWSERRRREFAEAMADLVDRSHALDE